MSDKNITKQIDKNNLLNNYTQHRYRLRNRMILHGDSLHNYEAVELLLFTALPRKDTKQIAKRLIKEFGSIWEILNAKKEDLLKIEGIGESVFYVIKTYKFVFEAIYKENLYKKTISLDSTESVIHFCKFTLGLEDVEHCYVFYLDSSNNIIHHEKHSTGSALGTSINIREIAKKATNMICASVILIHNHPTGSTKPSKQDYQITSKLSTALNIFDIELIDHIIIAKNKAYSIIDDRSYNLKDIK